MPPDVSVVIAARNSAGTLGATLEALRDQTVGSDRYEVFVVDDHSDDGTAELAAGYEHVQVIRAETHVGLPRARNLAIRVARGRLIAFTDDDCVVDPDYIERGLARFDGDDAPGMIACRTTILAGPDSGNAELIDAARHFDQEGYVADGYAAGCGLWVRAELAHEVGGLNEKLPAYGGEDFEFGRLLTSRGTELVYAPEVHQTHPPRQTLRELAGKSYRLGRCMVALRKHSRGPGPPPPVYLRPWILLPRPGVQGMHRLEARGLKPGPFRRAVMVVQQWLFLQLPFGAGEIAASLGIRERSS